MSAQAEAELKPVAMASRGISLLIGTRKGVWFFTSDPKRNTWHVNGPHFLGNIINHIVRDPRDGRTLLMAAKTGHLGPTIFRSTDEGRNWAEAKSPPAFPKSDDPNALAVSHTFWLSPGHSSEPDVWWAGTSPPGLFESRDGGATWENVSGFNQNPMYLKWCPPGDGTPDGALLNQILIDPRDARHMYLATSTGGVFESNDRAKTWQPLNKGVQAAFLPDQYPEYGQDAHYIAIHPQRPDRLYQQNHCGIYRIDRPSDLWKRIGENMPKEIGDIGFTILAHPRNPDMAWVFPMDGTRLVHGQAPGLLRRRSQSPRPLSRYDRRRALDEQRRRRNLAPDCRSPA
jgi:photosystem II stability/assembly factor-like uncharacterized protein